MRPFSLKRTSATYGGLIEKIEILRSTLRWASKLERPEIQKLLNQCNEIRDEVMQLSRKERFVQASVATETQEEQAAPPNTPSKRKLRSTSAWRRSRLDWRG